MKDEEIEKVLNICTFGQRKEDRCKDCLLDSDKQPCITNLHLATLEYIQRLKAENEHMKNQIAQMVTPPCKLDDILYMPHIVFQDGYDDYGNVIHNIAGEVEKITVDRQNFYQVCYWIERNRAFFSEEAAMKNLQHKFDSLKE